MKLYKKYLSFLLTIVLSLSLVSCNSETPAKVQAKFDNFLEDAFIESVTSDTLTLHYKLKDASKYGIKDSKPTLGSFSIKDIKDEYKDLEKSLKSLKSFEYNSLTEEQQTTYDILKSYLETEIKGKDFAYYHTIFSPTTGLQANLPITLAEYKFYDKDDVKDYLGLCKDIDRYFKDIMEYEGEKSKKGLFMADFAVDDIIAQCEAFISDPENSYLITTFNNKIDALTDLTDEEKNNLKNENKKTILESVIPAYKNLIDSLNKLKGTGKNTKGLCNFPKGKNYYEYLVESTTGCDKSIKTIKKELVTRLTKLFKDMGSIINNSPDTVAALDKNNYETNNPNEILDILKDRINSFYPEPPSTTYEVRYVDKSLEEHLSPAFYLIPPIDDYKSNVVYINNSQVDNSRLFTTLAHEGYPGHLYQTTYFNATNPNPIRNVLSFGGYTEGWATYAEIQSYELANFNNDSLTKLSQIYSEITLAIPTLIDIGVNYEGWNLDNTKKYIVNFGFDASMAENIYNSVIEEPANYLQYYVGYLQFVELRDKAKDKLGKDFDLKEFNKVILDVGPAPFSVLENKVDEYIKGM